MFVFYKYKNYFSFHSYMASPSQNLYRVQAGSDIRGNYQYHKMPPKLSTYVKKLHNKRILIFNWESRGPHPIEEFSSDRRFLFFLKVSFINFPFLLDQLAFILHYTATKELFTFNSNFYFEFSFRTH